MGRLGDGCGAAGLSPALRLVDLGAVSTIWRRLCVNNQGAALAVAADSGCHYRNLNFMSGRGRFIRRLRIGT